MCRADYLPLALFIALLAALAPAYSQIYKWVDEQGRVRYSDKKPDDQATSVAIKPPGLPTPPTLEPLNPRYHQGRQPSRWLYFYPPVLALAKEAADDESDVRLFFGEDCVSPLPLEWRDFSERYDSFLPRWNYVMNQVDNSVQRLGYRFAPGFPHKIARQLEKNRGLLLEAAIVDIHLNACAPQLVKNVGRRRQIVKYSQDLTGFSLPAFTRVQNLIKVRWTLRENPSSEPIFVAFSDGVSATKLRTEGTVSKAIIQSFRDALLRLFSQLAFVDHLNQDAELGAQAIPKAIVMRPGAIQRGALGKLADNMGRNYLKRAEFAKILSIISPLKMMVTEYYMREGQWPTDVGDIAVESHHLTEPGLIDAVNIAHEGTISIDIASAFGENAVIWLTPVDKQLRLDWRCMTNVDKAATASACENF